MSDYYIYDGRYWTDPDRALVMTICDTLEEAREDVKDYGDAVIVYKGQIVT